MVKPGPILPAAWPVFTFGRHYAEPADATEQMGEAGRPSQGSGRRFGWGRKAISIIRRPTRQAKSRAIQDFVVDHLFELTTDDSGIAIAPDNMTLLVAPVVEADASPIRRLHQPEPEHQRCHGWGSYFDGESSEDDSSKTIRPTLRATALHPDEQAQAGGLVMVLSWPKESGMLCGISLGNDIRDI